MRFLFWMKLKFLKSFPVRVAADILILIGNPRGLFITESAYHLWMEACKPMHQKVQTENMARKLWNRIWQMMMPNRVKIFAWRASKGILPAKTLLVKHVLHEANCEVCHLQ